MKSITPIIILILSCISFCFKSQAQASEHLFIVKNNGDTLVTSKIFDKGTHEDQVTYIEDGVKRELNAKEITSYFDQSLKVRIKTSPDNKSKLVTTIIKGHIFLARSISSKKVHTFYILHEKQWIKLDPSIVNLKQKLSKSILDFDQVIQDKKIYYNLVSLGDVVARYNEYKDSNFKKVGKFRFRDKAKFGVYGSLGGSFATIGESNSYLGFSLNRSVGIGTHIQYGQTITGLIKLGYSRSYWEYENIVMDFRSIDFSPVLLTQLYNYSNSVKVSGGIGLNMMLYFDSQLITPRTGLSAPNRLALGYVLHLSCSFGENFEIFTCYQHMPNQNSAHNGIFTNGDRLEFESKTIQLGGLFYFKRI